MNKDGELDVAMIVPQDSFGTVYIGVSLGNGDGTFKTASQYPGSSVLISAYRISNSITAADINGDSYPDLSSFYLRVSAASLQKRRGCFDYPDSSAGFAFLADLTIRGQARSHDVIRRRRDMRAYVCRSTLYPVPLSDYVETQESVPPGGYAVVRFAVNRLSNEPVAIKRPRTDEFAPKDAGPRFIQEAKQLVSLTRRSETGFVRVIEANADPDRGELYMVMERCAGDLAGLAPQLHEPAGCALWIALVCDALAALHNRRTGHRDLKPGNLLVRDDGSPCIADLGSCLPFEDILQMSLQGETFPGTPEYMAPETIGASLLPEVMFYPADVYAVEVILYELLGGRPPFVREDYVGSAMKIEQVVPSQLPPLLRTRRPDIPRQLEDIVHQCLEKTPSLRPAAWDLARYLRQFAGFHSDVFRCEDEVPFEKEKRRNLIACIPVGDDRFRLQVFDHRGDPAVEVNDSRVARYGGKAELLRRQLRAWSPPHVLSGYEKQLLTVSALAVIDPGVIAGLLEARAPSQRVFSPVYVGRIVKFREYVQLPIAVLSGGDGTTTFRSGKDGTDDGSGSSRTSPVERPRRTSRCCSTPGIWSP